MTAKQELLTMWEQVDESGKQLIFDMLACTVAFGDSFLEEMQELIARGDKDKIRGALAKWTAPTKERSKAQRA